MDPKRWLQGKRSPAVNSETKTLVKGNEEEKLECKCNVNDKDKLVAGDVKATQEANTGRENAEALVGIQKQEVQDVLQQKIVALKNGRQQLRCLKVGHKKLESKYTEARKKLANLTVENARLSKGLTKKKEIIRNVSNQMSEAKEEFNKLVLRLDSTERRNDVLKYEYSRLVEKELKMRSLHADVAKRRQLEAERQKLRLLVNPKMKVAEKRMIKQLCELEEENKRKENEIQLLSAEVARVNEQNNFNLGKLLESEKKIESLKGLNEEHLDNLKLINYDLDNQLSAAKVQIKEAFQKVSFLEMELEDKSDHRQELEAAWLQLQLKLASVSVKDEVKEEKLLETMLNPQELKISAELSNNKMLTQHSSLRDQMAAEDLISTIDTSNRDNKIVQWALPLVPCNKYGKGTRLLKKFLFRRKRGGNKKKMVAFAA